MMALFAVLFGARRVDATRHREGLMLAIAFESLLKLLAFVAIGIFAALHMRGHPWVLPTQLAHSATLLNGNAASITLLAAMAIFCLPRQFQVAAVECAHVGDLKTARWLLPAYLGLFSVMVIPVEAAQMRARSTSRSAWRNSRPNSFGCWACCAPVGSTSRSPMIFGSPRRRSRHT
jgi:Na+/proline symporter